jgi:mediator of RNA polymerase II transcription subunit 13
MGTGRGSVPPFASVPTPVSPAAALGAASEQSKSLESAAHAIAVEFVENTLWAEVWRVNNQRGHGAVHEGARKVTVWPDDLKVAAEVMRKVNTAKEDGQESLCEIGTLFGLGEYCQGLSPSESTTDCLLPDPSTKLLPYDPPSISVGKGDAVIQLLPTALRFWQKLGLGPKGGRKDIEVYAFYEDADDQKRVIVDGWLAAAGNAYKTKHMGQFIRGCTNPANDALLPTRFDVSFRKTFGTHSPPFRLQTRLTFSSIKALFISNIINAGPPIVILFFVPVTSMTFTSPSLRSVFLGIKKVLKTFHERQITFHFVPDSYLIDLDHSPRGYAILDELCMGVYNRIHVEVERNLSRRMLGQRRHSNTIQLQEPTFTLARSVNNKVSLVRSAHTSLDVVDRFTFLHVGYRISPCRKWVFACCVDQRGEEYDLGLWLVSPPESGDGEGEPSELGDGEREIACERFAVDKAWSFAMEVARRVDVEWRVVVTKLGLMTPTEVEAWTESYAKDAMVQSKTSTPLHLILASADHNSPFTLIARSSSSPLTTLPNSSSVSPPRVAGKGMSTNAKASTQFIDISAAYYAVFPTSQLSVVTPPKLDIYSASFVSEPTPSHTPALHHGQEGTSPAGILDISATSSPNPSTTTSPSAVTSPFKQEDSSSLPHPIPFIPLASSILIRVPSTSPISMLRIYIIKALHPLDFNDPHSTSSPAPIHAPPSTQDDLTRDLTRNFYELSVLSSARFHLDRCESVGIDSVLPLHLSAVDSMRFCVDCDWDDEMCSGERGSE